MNRVATVEMTMPVIITTPIGAIISEPSPPANTIGTRPRIVVSAVISTGRTRDVYKRQLQRFLRESGAAADSDASRALAEQAFLAGWRAAGGELLLVDRIPMEDEK